MESISLSDTYLRAKRYLIFFSAVLALTSVVGLAPNESSNLLGWSIGNPRYTSTVLFFVVLYYLGQLALFWNVQGQQIKELAQHSVDYSMSICIAIVALYSLPTVMLLERCGYITPQHPEQIDGEFFAAWLILALPLLPILGTLSYLFIFKDLLNRSRRAQITREIEVLRVLTTSRWKLVFNPEAFDRTNGERGSKAITFLENGEIGEGRNKNEFTWRMSSGFLEILNDAEKIFSRFRYDPVKITFRHTNDDDTPSIRNQYITLIESQHTP